MPQRVQGDDFLVLHAVHLHVLECGTCLAGPGEQYARRDRRDRKQTDTDGANGYLLMEWRGVPFQN